MCSLFWVSDLKEIPNDKKRLLSFSWNILDEIILTREIQEKINEYFKSNNIQLQDSQKTVYMTGGLVRNALLNKPAKDLDLSWGFDSNLIKDLFNWRVTSKNNTLMFKFKETQIEYTPFLSLDGNPPSLQTDALRRDFTVNSMYLHPYTLEITDLFWGQNDLKNKILNGTWNSEDRIQEDPLRILRLFRFSEKIRESSKIETPVIVSEDMKKAISSNLNKLTEISQERIFPEIQPCINSLNYWKDLKDYKILNYISPVFRKLYENWDLNKNYLKLFKILESKNFKGKDSSFILAILCNWAENLNLWQQDLSKLLINDTEIYTKLKYFIIYRNLNIFNSSFTDENLKQQLKDLLFGDTFVINLKNQNHSNDLLTIKKSFFKELIELKINEVEDKDKLNLLLELNRLLEFVEENELNCITKENLNVKFEDLQKKGILSTPWDFRFWSILLINLLKEVQLKLIENDKIKLLERASELFKNIKLTETNSKIENYVKELGDFLKSISRYTLEWKEKEKEFKDLWYDFIIKATTLKQLEWFLNSDEKNNKNKRDYEVFLPKLKIKQKDFTLDLQFVVFDFNTKDIFSFNSRDSLMEFILEKFGIKKELKIEEKDNNISNNLEFKEINLNL